MPVVGARPSHLSAFFALGSWLCDAWLHVLKRNGRTDGVMRVCALADVSA